MLFENLTVTRIVMHEVHRRLDDRQPTPPVYGTQLLNLPAEAMTVFQDRIIAAMGSQSQSMEMAFANYAAGSAVEIARDIIDASDADFVSQSRRYADKLTETQISRSLPGGILIVFTGQAGNPAKKIVGIIKAETHGGFRRTNGMQAQYLRDLFMTPQTKLYKIGVYYCDLATPTGALPQGWGVSVYDSQMSNGHREGAAQYFYGIFLGCAIPTNSAQLTKKFFEETKEFINKIDANAETKSDLFTGLYTYLRVDQSPTIEVSAFSQSYLTPDLQDDYQAFMGRKSFPTTAVSKDLSDVQKLLRRRKLTFPRDVQLTAPPDAFADFIQVETIHPEPENGDGTPGPAWTRITIRDRVRDQE